MRTFVEMQTYLNCLECNIFSEHYLSIAPLSIGPNRLPKNNAINFPCLNIHNGMKEESENEMTNKKNMQNDKQFGMF